MPVHNHKMVTDLYDGYVTDMVRADRFNLSMCLHSAPD
jgi:hypothetical protein